MNSEVVHDQLESDLREQHPELRLRLHSNQSLRAWCRSIVPESPGSYDWWEINAFDETGSGFTASIAVGNPFDPAYRTAVRNDRLGRLDAGGVLRRSRFCATRCSIFENGQLIARHASTFDWQAKATSENEFRIGSDHVALTHHDDDSWTLTVDAPTQAHGIRGVLTPGRADRGRITAALRMTPMPGLRPLSRTLLPDSPAGSTHDWLLAVGRASVSGTVEITSADKRTRSTNLESAQASIDSFRGTGPLGEGVRRFFLAWAPIPEGVVVGELVIVRKYIQIAPTLLVLHQSGHVEVMRCDRVPRATFQRSKWLLAYPMKMTWRHEMNRWHIDHSLPGLHEAQPCRSLTLTDAAITCPTQSGSDLVRNLRAAGRVRLIQPSRLDSWMWRWWLRMPTHSD